MSNYIASDTDLTSVANAIRTKGNTQAALEFPNGFVNAIGSIPTGGGAANIVTGTFTGETNGAKTIDVGYTGNGYPIALYIFNSSGKLSGVDGIDIYLKRLTDTSASPSYSGTYGQLLYRTVTSGGTVTNKGDSSVMMTYTAAVNGINLAAVLSAKSTLQVYIGTSNTNFAQNVQYTYAIVYNE